MPVSLSAAAFVWGERGGGRGRGGKGERMKREREREEKGVIEEVGCIVICIINLFTSTV